MWGSRAGGQAGGVHEAGSRWGEHGVLWGVVVTWAQGSLWRRMEVMLAQGRECTKCHWVVPFNVVHFTLYQFYLTFF